MTVIDAHYVMFDATLKVKSIKPGEKWELSVYADDHADVSVQHYADINNFAKDNFWTDKKIEKTPIIANKKFEKTPIFPKINFEI